MAARTGDPAGKGGKGSGMEAFRAHQLTDAWDFTIQNGARSFRGDVSRGHAGAACREDGAHLARIRNGYQAFADEADVVGNHIRDLDAPAQLLQTPADRGARDIRAFSRKRGIA